MEFYSFADLFLTPLYIIIAMVIAWMIKSTHRSNQVYNYLLPGLTLRLIGTLGFCAVYTLYYGGGDTTGYFHSSGTLINLLEKSPVKFMEVILGNNSAELYHYFDAETGYPWYWGDFYAFTVVKLTVPFTILGFGSFPAASILVSILCFAVQWRLFLKLVRIFKGYDLPLFIGILCVPSVLFWSGGILKDTYTMIAMLLVVSAMVSIIHDRKFNIWILLSLVSGTAVMLLVKPYIFLALIPATLIWAVFPYLQRIRNLALKILLLPVLVGIGMAFGFGVWSVMGMVAEEYNDVDALVQSAYEKNVDLKQAYYGGHSFDIGDYDPTLGGMLSKFPEATIAGLYRPFLWEAENIVMLVSALENILLMLLMLLILFRFRSFIRLNNVSAFIMFSLVFTITLAFIIGVSTSNFGSLVRFKIPFMPFIVSTVLMILWKKSLHSDKYENMAA